MKFSTDDMGTPTLTITDNLFLEFKNEWEQLYGVISGRAKYNWINITFIQLFFMVDDLFPGWELEAMLLGVGFRLRYNSEDAKRKFLARMEE